MDVFETSEPGTVVFPWRERRTPPILDNLVSRDRRDALGLSKGWSKGNVTRPSRLSRRLWRFETAASLHLARHLSLFCAAFFNYYFIMSKNKRELKTSCEWQFDAVGPTATHGPDSEYLSAVPTIYKHHLVSPGINVAHLMPFNGQFHAAFSSTFVFDLRGSISLLTNGWFNLRLFFSLSLLHTQL